MKPTKSTMVLVISLWEKFSPDISHEKRYNRLTYMYMKLVHLKDAYAKFTSWNHGN